jgi:hypothetical protein
LSGSRASRVSFGKFGGAAVFAAGAQAFDQSNQGGDEQIAQALPVRENPVVIHAYEEVGAVEVHRGEQVGGGGGGWGMEQAGKSVNIGGEGLGGIQRPPGSAGRFRPGGRG